MISGLLPAPSPEAPQFPPFQSPGGVWEKWRGWVRPEILCTPILPSLLCLSFSIWPKAQALCMCLWVLCACMVGGEQEEIGSEQLFNKSGGGELY